jgi:hypothetical protein
MYAETRVDSLHLSLRHPGCLMHAGTSPTDIFCRVNATGNGGRTNLTRDSHFDGLAHQHAASDRSAVKDTNTCSLADKYIDQYADTD